MTAIPRELDPARIPDGCHPVITVRGLRNAFGEQLIHDGVDLTVCRGEILGVVGGSGTGKSVLLRSIIGLQTPEAGQVEVLGESMIDRPEDEAKNIRRRWGILFQNGALFSTLTVAENVEVPLREYFPYITPPLLDEIASYKIAMGGLPPDAGPKYPSELSGGMVKRAGLARALALDPELLFLDEPTAGLDPQSRIALWEILGGLHDEGQTILLTTHYMEEADQLCQRVAIIDHGKLLALDTPAALKRSIGADTEVRMHASGDLAALVRNLEEVPGVERARIVDDTVYVYMKAGGPTLPELITHAAQAGCEIQDVGVTETSLETVFINLTGRELRE
jgi:phospholipid/cholesterol/gamma-HCH transport system ATP-binding protein